VLSPPEQQFVAHVEQSNYGAATVLLALLWTVESLAPMYAGRRRRLSHAGANLGLAVINAFVAYAGAFGILFVTEASRARGFGLVYQADLPAALRWVLAILLFDVWQYWWHRLNHTVAFFWRFHSVHHSDAELDATSAIRFHTLEITFSILARLVVLPLIGMTVPQLVIYEGLSLLIVMFHHSNIRLPQEVDRSLRWLVVTPWMHWVHHSDLRHETDSNYSSFLSVWDRIFRSFRLRERPEEIRIGLPGRREEDWRTLGGMLLAPFREPPPTVTSKD
jgi:sterol desaturase/sphingolipid hydroxylase (fatty acid hydroxylase superfamily)